MRVTGELSRPLKIYKSAFSALWFGHIHWVVRSIAPKVKVRPKRALRWVSNPPRVVNG